MSHRHGATIPVTSGSAPEALCARSQETENHRSVFALGICLDGGVRKRNKEIQLKSARQVAFPPKGCLLPQMYGAATVRAAYFGP
jgi:hypothetical protein